MANSTVVGTRTRGRERFIHDPIVHSRIRPPRGPGRDAAHVIAVDVGHGQLDESLRRDPRVMAIEGLNTKDIGAEPVSEPFDLIVCDLSFISLKKALPAALSLAPSGADLIALIKPQFEVGKGRLGKGGVVKEEGLHEEVCVDIAEWLSALPGWTVTGITPSPIEGGDGNREFLIAAHHD